MKNDTLINRIINLRYSHDWSQAELGRRIGLDKSTMNKIENSTRKIQTDELKLLGQVFNVSMDYLLNGSDNPKKSVNNDKKEKIETIAAHIDEDATEEDMKDILNFIDYINKRDKK